VRAAESMSAGIAQFSARAMPEQVIVLPPVKQAVNVTDLFGVSSVLAWEGALDGYFWSGRKP